MLTGTLAPITTSEDWTETIILTDEQTGAPFDLTDCLVEIAVTDRGSRDDYDHAPLNAVVLRATSADGTGRLQIDGGTISVFFDRGTMGCLAPTTLGVGITIERDGDRSQLFLGELPLLRGLV